MMQVTPAIYAIRHPFKVPVAPGIAIDRFVYTYFIAGDTIALVDTGVSGCEQRIFDGIRSIGRDPAEISLVLLTHSHPDHIGAARAVRDATGCAIAAHPAERSWIEDPGLQNRERPVPGFSELVGGPVPVDFELDGADTIDPDGSGEYEIQVFPTPGHSPGSISLFMPGEGALFCGDTVPVHGDLPVYDDVVRSIRSIRLLRNIQGVRHLLSAWDQPRSGDDGYGSMDKGLAYIKKIHGAVHASAGTGDRDLMAVTRDTAALLGIPSRAVSPLLARTFAAHLQAGDDEGLLES